MNAIEKTSLKLATEKQKRESWTVVAEEMLLQWMETLGNYDRYRCATQPSAGGRCRTSGDSKISISENIVLYRTQHNIVKTGRQVRTKIENYEKAWKTTHHILNITGEGVTDEDIREITDKNVLKGKQYSERFEQRTTTSHSCFSKNWKVV